MINMLEIKKDDLLIDVFPNISELYNWCKKTPRRGGADDSSESNGCVFTGTESLEEAYNKLIYGDDELFKEISSRKNKIDITKIIGNKINKPKIFDDVVGFQANVPNYLKGIPTTMINQEPKKMSQKVLNIVIDGSVSAFVNKRQIQSAGILYATIIDLLEKLGYRCNLYLAQSSEYNGHIYILLTRVKTDREPFNLKKLAFCIAHPSYFRRIGFKWIESADIGCEPTHSGYGRPYNEYDRLKILLEDELKINIILWKIQNNWEVSNDKIKEKLKETGIDLDD